MSQFARAVRYWGAEFVEEYGDECRCPRPVVLRYVFDRVSVPTKAYSTSRCNDCGLIVKAREMKS